MGTVALDSSVLIALMNRRDAHHQAAGSLLRAKPSDTRYLIGATVYAEILVRASRLGTVDQVDSVLDLFAVDIVAIDRAVARRAAMLRAEGVPRLTIADAFCVAVALSRTPPASFLTFDGALQRRYEAEVAGG